MDKKRVYLAISGVVLGIVFVYLSFLVHWGVFRTLDRAVTAALQGAISLKLDPLLSAIQVLGSAEFTVLALGAIAAYIVLRRRQAPVGLSLFLALFVVELWGKGFLFHLGPPASPHKGGLGILLPSSVISSMFHTRFSFPSGHMARTTFICVTLLMLWHTRRTATASKLGGTLLIVLALIGMAVSLICLGAHWFSDVAGGLVLGSSFACLAASLWDRKE